MDGHDVPPATSSATSGSNSHPAGPQLSVYSGIPDRQAVQVIQQALHRQPSTAAQYLQQMYAAQQQHLMLQTAALQQHQHQHHQHHQQQPQPQHHHHQQQQQQQLQPQPQHQSLPTPTQQANLAANRPGASSGNNGPAQTPAQQQPTLSLSSSPAAAQLLTRAQGMTPATAATSGLTQQAVLLGNASSPALTASQAQMYLRAQMAQQGHLVQVARSLGRAVPLSPQLIFTPSPAPAQAEGAGNTPPTTTCAQAQRPPQALAPSPSQQLPTLAMKPAPNANSQASSSLASGPQGKGPGAKEPPSEPLRKAEAGVGGGSGGTSNGTGGPPEGGGVRGPAPNRTTSIANTHPLIAPAFASLQSHQFVSQQPKAAQHQFVIQPQLQPRATQPMPPSSSSSHLPNPGPTSIQGCHPHKPGGGASANPSCLQATHNARPAAALQRQEVGSSVRSGGCPNHTAQRKVATHQAQAPAGTETPRKEATEKLPPADPPAPPHTTPSPTLNLGATGTPRHDAAAPEGPVPPPPARSPGGGMTSGNGTSASSVAGAAPQNGESHKPPQAVVKPQVLTHLIEGFVIQEGAEPFPVGRSSLLVGSLKKKYAQALLGEKAQSPHPQPHQQDNNTTTTDSEMEDPYLQESKDEGSPPKLKCELCGRLDFAYKFKRSKRFCSMACAKRYNVGCTKRVGLFHPDRNKPPKQSATPHNRRRNSKTSLPVLGKESKKQVSPALPPTSGPGPLQQQQQHLSRAAQEDSSRGSDNSSYEEPLSPLSASSSTSRRRRCPSEREVELTDVRVRDLVAIGHHFLPSEPHKWNVEDVHEFIRSLPGCQEIAEEFRAQEIDGQALLLLKEDHLMSAMNIKLGPALKIYARICMLKDS
ncbi:polyhomeotic-like protein 2 isoform X2 [Anolis sagrei]|uniref:polyhomeotic-like protein 2 isoform X2 n=1 Tax=Anolis sagrei TaxID=38937 RepID=UPI00352162C2